MSLDEFRKKIDEIDLKLVELVNQRATLAGEIGKIKLGQGGDLYVPSREMAIHQRTAEASHGPLPDASLRNIFREVISACRNLEGRQIICYLGPPGSFTEEAARRHFGSAPDYMPASDIALVFNEVASGRANFGVVPIENTTIGGIADTLDRFAHTEINICSEVVLSVHLYLMARCSIEEVTHVYSKPQALSQCQQWLRQNLPDAVLCDAESTSQAAKIAQEAHTVAAIAHQSAADLYDLNVLANAIEDHPENTTKFFVLGHGFGKPTGHDKTSLMVSLRHEVGSLYDALLVFKKNGINLTKIESRPNQQRKWQYYFFIDIEGHCEDETVKRALGELKEATAMVQVLGSYPMADE